MKIKVLRLIEYEFTSYEVYKAHTEISAVPFTGNKLFGTTVIRSAVIDYPVKEKTDGTDN